MIVPLAMTLWFSLEHFNLLTPGARAFAGLENYLDLLTGRTLWIAMGNTLFLVGLVLLLTLLFGTLFALLLHREFPGRTICRMLVVAPFFMMPTVSALIWKNMLMNPVSGLFAWLAQSVGLTPVDWFTNAPLLSVILIVSWQWLPFASLIMLTALQSLDEEQKEAAALDGVGAIPFFFYIVLPHIARAMTVVILIETIFLLSVFAEIYVTTNGGPSTTNIPFLVYELAQHSYDVGGASAGGVVAVILANIVAFFLVRIVGKNLSA
jgi:sorbitol/mannitol transport system permease protein